MKNFVLISSCFLSFSILVLTSDTEAKIGTFNFQSQVINVLHVLSVWNERRRLCMLILSFIFMNGYLDL